MASLTCVNGLPVLYHLKCLFRVLSCSPWLLSWSNEGKTSWAIIITQTRKGGKKKEILSHPSCCWCDLNSFAPPVLLDLMSHVRGWHLPFHSLPRPDPHASSNERKLDLMDWIGSRPSYSFPMSSIPVKDSPVGVLSDYQKNRILPAFASSFLNFPRLLTTRSWTSVTWRGQSGEAGVPMAEIARAWSQGLLSPAFISHKHAQAKQRLATFLIARPTSWCNYTLRKLTRRRVCCCRSI